MPKYQNVKEINLSIVPEDKYPQPGELWLAGGVVVLKLKADIKWVIIHGNSAGTVYQLDRVPDNYQYLGRLSAQLPSQEGFTV